MARTLKKSPFNLPVFRVRTAAKWGGTWRDEPMLTRKVNGLQVVQFDRKTLPDFGKAILQYHYGEINGRLYGVSGSGDSLDVSTPKLLNREIVIDALQPSEPNEGGDSAVWKTVWWGECIAEQDLAQAGSEFPSGVIEYHCRDGLFRTSRWVMSRHQMYQLTLGECVGHPGYNTSGDEEAILGNREPTGADSTGAGYTDHIWPRLPREGEEPETLRWTLQQAIEHAFSSSMHQKPGPEFELKGHESSDGKIDLLQGVQAWPVSDQMTVWDFLKTHLDRRKVFCVAFLEWDDDDITQGMPYLKVSPVLYEDVSTVLPGKTDGNGLTASFSLAGAVSTTGITTVDLRGDHRLVDETFQAVRESATQFDVVETYGENIEIVVTLSTGNNSLEKRWTDKEATDFEELNDIMEADAEALKFHHVWRNLGIPFGWEFLVGSGIAGEGVSRCDYWTNENGQIELPDRGQGRGAACSPLLLEVKDRLPMYAGYDYSTNGIPKYDSTTDVGSESMPIGVWILAGKDDDNEEENTQGQDYWVDAFQEYRVQVSRAGNNGTDLSIRDSEQSGRFLEGLEELSDLALTVSLQLPHRVNMRSAQPNLVSEITDGGLTPINAINGVIQAAVSNDSRVPVGRTKRIYAAGCRLALIHPDAIWSLDASKASNGGFAPRRQAAGSSSQSTSDNGTVSQPVVGVLRDDRNEIAKTHAIAKAWYLTPRRTATWQLRTFGMDWIDREAGTEEVEATNSEEAVSFPRLGDLVVDIGFSGRVEEFKTPVTSVSYDHRSGVTTWITSWSDRDWRTGR